jgi:hypothetical protein
VWGLRPASGANGESNVNDVNSVIESGRGESARDDVIESGNEEVR